MTVGIEFVMAAEKVMEAGLVLLLITKVWTAESGPDIQIYDILCTVLFLLVLY